MNSFVVNAIVEISKGSLYKYELNKETGLLLLDRPLKAPMPYNYGFIPYTLCEDGDPLDIIIISQQPIIPMTEVQAVVHGVLQCKDAGVSDDKLIASIVGEETDISLDTDFLNSYISDYLNFYKSGFVVNSYKNAIGAKQLYDFSKVWVDTAN